MDRDPPKQPHSGEEYVRASLRQGGACGYAAQAAEGWQAQQGGRQGTRLFPLCQGE